MPPLPNGRNSWFRNLSFDVEELAEHELENSSPFNWITLPIRNNVFASFFDNYFMNEIDFAKSKVSGTFLMTKLKIFLFKFLIVHKIKETRYTEFKGSNIFLWFFYLNC